MPPLSDAEASSRASGSPVGGTMRGLDQASMMGMELVSAILLWTGVGWLLDRWLGSDPWLLVVGAMLGYGAGIYLVWLRGQRMDEAEARVGQDARGGR